jgi:hypothetical protein
MGFSATRPPASPKETRTAEQQRPSRVLLALRLAGPRRNRQTLMGFCTSSLIRIPEGISPATRAMVGSLAHGFTSGALWSLPLWTTLFGSRPGVDRLVKRDGSQGPACR